jgi:hypothetical protein
MCFFWYTKVAELEKEVENQKERRLMYKKRLERIQEYLRYCLQTAQENGFLHLIIDDKDGGQQSLHLTSDIVNASSPQQPTLLHQHSDLAAIVDQAKFNGWHIHPHQVSRLFNEYFSQNTHNASE